MTDDLEPVTADGPTPEAAATSTPLLAPTAMAAPTEAVTRPVSLAFLAAAGTALAGALLWAGIVIATGYNIGFLALIIGGATGLTAQRVAGGPVGGFERAVAGVFAAGAIVVGRYVIFVHDVRTQLHASVGYLDSHVMNVFADNFTTIIHGFDWFWIAIAAFAAFRTAGGIAVLGMGRARV
jgi:hypothetical protein